MFDESYLIIRFASRLSEESMSFIVEDLRFQLNIKVQADNFDLSIKEIASGANYVSQKNFLDFAKSEIFKVSQNSNTVKEIIFQIIINSNAKICFNQNKCYLKLNNNNLNFNNSSSYVIEFQEDKDIIGMLQNYMKKTDSLERDNRTFKIELEKLNKELLTYKEDKKKGLKEIETQSKNEINFLKKEVEKLSILVSNFLNNSANNTASNNNIHGFVNASLQNSNNNNNLINKFSSGSPQPQSQTNAKNLKYDKNLKETHSVNNNPAGGKSANLFSPLSLNKNNSINANEASTNKQNKTFINDNDKSKSPSPNKVVNGTVTDRRQKVNNYSLSHNNLFYDNNVLTNTLNDSPPLAIRQQVEELKENKFFQSLKGNEKIANSIINAYKLKHFGLEDNSNNNKDIQYISSVTDKNTISKTAGEKVDPLHVNSDILKTNQSKALPDTIGTLIPQQSSSNNAVLNNLVISEKNICNNNYKLYEITTTKNPNNTGRIVRSGINKATGNFNSFEENKAKEAASSNVNNNHNNNKINIIDNEAENFNSNKNETNDAAVRDNPLTLNLQNHFSNLVKNKNSLINKVSTAENKANNDDCIPNNVSNRISQTNNLVEAQVKNQTNKINFNLNNNLNSANNANVVSSPAVFTFSNNMITPKSENNNKRSVSPNAYLNNEANIGINSINNKALSSNDYIIQNENEVQRDHLLNKQIFTTNRIKQNNDTDKVNNCIVYNNTNQEHLKNNELLNFICENPMNTALPYKYMELVLKKPISSFKLENNIKFFYQVNKGEISDDTLWSAFDEEDCIMLEIHYPSYLIGGPCEVYLENVNKLVNFKYMMLVDPDNPENHIHVKRGLPNKVENVIRKNKYNFEEEFDRQFLMQKMLPNINILKDYEKYSEYFTIFDFSFVKNFSFEVKIPKKFEYLYRECIKKSNYGGFVVSLREEIENLRKNQSKKNSIYLNYLDSLENSPKFFQIIMQMYSEDGYLVKELTSTLRKPNLENMNKIKYFYLAVLVSTTYCSLNVRPRLNNSYESSNIINTEYNETNNSEIINDEKVEIILKTENSETKKNKNFTNPEVFEKEAKDIQLGILNTAPNNSKKKNKNSTNSVDKNYFVYSPYKISEKELEFYKENKFNVLFSDEFISTTPNKTKAENYLKAFESFERENDKDILSSVISSFKCNYSSIKNSRKKISMSRDSKDAEAKKEEMKTNNIGNNIKVMFEIEIPYYMLENENMHVDSLAFVYNENFTIYPQDEEIILKSGSILMIKDIVKNSKEISVYTIKMIALSFSWKGFFDCLAYNFNTKEINLNKNSIGNFRKSVKYLCEALIKNKNIEKLSLRENNFGENYESMKYLANLISISSYGNLSKLENINFDENKNAMLLHNNNNNNNNNNDLINAKILNYFNISNYIYLNSIPKLKIIDLANNGIGKNSKIAKVFCEALQINQNITQIDLSNNVFSEVESAKTLATALICNKYLQKVDLSSNNLGSSLLATNYLSEVILVNKNIQILNLSDNNLGERPDIVKSLSEALARNSTLTKLNLSSNALGINSISVRHLAEGLILNESIIELDLKNNLLGNLESLNYLCALLEKNANLEVLDLGKNKFGIYKESYGLLGEAILKNQKIHTLSLSNNNLNTHLDYLKCLLDSIKLNSRLKKIYLSYNSLSNNDDFKLFIKNLLKDRNINYLGTTDVL